jgi:CxxC-x17-CxxC domain-containing protein
MMLLYAARFTERLRSPFDLLNLLGVRGGLVENFSDRNVMCVDCGSQFVFSAGEQEFHREKGFTHEPKHCEQCKAKRELAKTGVSLRRSKMAVTCAECGIHTTVPFKPRLKRPVLCATCFHKAKANNIGGGTSNGRVSEIRSSL